MGAPLRLVAIAGALIGMFASSLVGSSLPDPVRRKFDGEIKAGRILVLVDAAEEAVPAVEAAVTRTGAFSLPFEAPTALIRVDGAASAASHFQLRSTLRCPAAMPLSSLSHAGASMLRPNE